MSEVPSSAPLSDVVHKKKERITIGPVMNKYEREIKETIDATDVCCTHWKRARSN